MARCGACVLRPSCRRGALRKQTRDGRAAAEFALVCNGKEMPVSVNSENLLKTFPRGPYTTARTHQMNSVFEFEFHNRRIAESTKLMVEAGTLAQPRGSAPVCLPGDVATRPARMERRAQH
jgi:hypothetical protein